MNVVINKIDFNRYYEQTLDSQFPVLDKITVEFDIVNEKNKIIKECEVELEPNEVDYKYLPELRRYVMSLIKEEELK